MARSKILTTAQLRTPVRYLIQAPRVFNWPQNYDTDLDIFLTNWIYDHDAVEISNNVWFMVYQDSCPQPPLTPKGNSKL